MMIFHSYVSLPEGTPTIHQAFYDFHGGLYNGDMRINLGGPLKLPMTYILPGKKMAGQWEILVNSGKIQVNVK
jgi:hypothetical protein